MLCTADFFSPVRLSLLCPFSGRYTMSSYNQFTVFFILSYLFLFNDAHAQVSQDSAYTGHFRRPNNVEIFTGTYGSTLDFSDHRPHGAEYRMKANGSAYAGANITYKWLVLQASFHLPGTSLDRHVPFRYTQLKLKFGSRHYFFEPFYNRFDGLLLQNRRRDSFAILPGLDVYRAGTRFYYYTNTTRFSPDAGNRFKQQQLRSAGSAFIALSSQWQKIYWRHPSFQYLKDSATYTLLSNNPQWMSIVAKAGYTYHFTWRRGMWLAAPSLLLGEGVLQEINIRHTRMQQVKEMQAWLNAGLNGQLYYCFLNLSTEQSASRLLPKYMKRSNTNISVTAGYRFSSAKQKLLDLL